MKNVCVLFFLCFILQLFQSLDSFGSSLYRSTTHPSNCDRILDGHYSAANFQAIVSIFADINQDGISKLCLESDTVIYSPDENNDHEVTLTRNNLQIIGLSSSTTRDNLQIVGPSGSTPFLNTSNARFDGVYLKINNSNEVLFSNFSVVTNNHYYAAVSLDNSSHVTLNLLNLTTSGFISEGISIENNSQVDLIENSTITTIGGNDSAFSAHGIYIYTSSVDEINGLSISTNGENAHGISIHPSGGSSIGTLKNSRFFINHYQATGLYVLGNSTISLIQDINIASEGAGIVVYHAGRIDEINRIFIETWGGSSVWGSGIHIEGGGPTWDPFAASIGEIYNATILTHSNWNDGISVKNSTEGFLGESLEHLENFAISVEGNFAYGIRVGSASTYAPSTYVGTVFNGIISAPDSEHCYLVYEESESEIADIKGQECLVNE